MKKVQSLSFWAICVLAAVFFVRCGSQPEKVFVNPEFVKYVSAYTSGMVSKKAKITIELAKDAVESALVGTELKEDVIDFQPSVKGKAVWIATNVVQFEPEEDLDPGKRYTVGLKVDEFMTVDKGFEEFQFTFDVISPNFDVEFTEIQTIDKQKLRWQQLTGFVECADVESVDAVAALLSAELKSKQIKVKWEETTNPKKFKFIVDSIERGVDASALTVNWNGSPWNVDKEGEKVFEIPSIDNFMFLSARVENQPDQRLVLQFSDPVDEKQKLDGLIKIDNSPYVRYIIAGNQILVYPSSRIDNQREVVINSGIANVLGYKMKENLSINVSFENIKPEVRLVSKGVIMPSADGLLFPFEAVGLKEVDVRVFRIYSQNVPQFLQKNNFKGTSELYRVGKSLAKTTVSLEKYQNDLGQWNRYFLDLNEIIKPEPGALYNISIGFRKHQAYSVCEDADEQEEVANINNSWNDIGESEDSYWDYYDDYYYNWEDRKNPCHKAYYGRRHSVSQNILSSNMGIIAKKGRAGQVVAYITDLLSGKPLEGVTVEILDFQQMKIYEGLTDGNGKISSPLKTDEIPYFIVAKKGEERAYLRLADGNTLSTSMFNVSGVDVRSGLKAFIFGERGVWRPGDSLYVSVIVEDASIPAEGEKPPVVFEFTNPNGQLYDRQVEKRIDDDFYTFRLATNPDDITGDWNAKVRIGAAEFNKSLKVETIKPNRLKINFDFGKEKLVINEPASAKMNVKWLHGAPAKNLRAKVDVSIFSVPTKFDAFADFVFDDKTKSVSASSENIFDDKLDASGNADISAILDIGSYGPGMLRANFFTKVFEKSGDFSVDNYSLPYHPYEEYIGLQMPKGDAARNMLLTDTTHSVRLVVVDKDGKTVNENRSVQVKLYKLSWKWWWDNTSNDVSNYSYNSYSSAIVDQTITVNGKGTWDLRIDYPQWGRYLAVVKNMKTGHSSSKVVYFDWPGWAGKSREGQNSMASMLTLTTNKEDYSLGEKINLTIPSPANGHALISIENGSSLVKEFWVETTKGETNISIDATEDMLPNAYIHTMVLQPHGQKDNDLPMRLYGIKNVNVVDETTKLHPVIEVADELAPETNVTFKVKEKTNREMSYVVAVVDEGLLDLTRFKTPDPWSSFYAKEALGVKTWDLYDWVIGAYNGKLERVLKVGGGWDESEEDSGNKNSLRFKPVVKFFGPYKLKGGEKIHQFKMPMYIGSVKFMVIARNGETYGNAEKAVAVKQPVMVMASLPRVLNPGDKISLPVTVFSMSDKKRDVQVSVSNRGLVKLSNNTQTVSFSESGDKTVVFEGVVSDRIGKEHFEVFAKSGKDEARYVIDIDVRSPNPEITMVESAIVEAGKSWELDFDMFGMKGTNSASVEVSGLPPIDLDKRMKYLVRYPHGCIEQTTSSVFPQLALTEFSELSLDEKNKIASNITAGIDRLKMFQASSGGFVYWPGNSRVVDWATCYAGHFLIEAKDRGYSVPKSMLKRWRKYQQKAASDWSSSSDHEQLIQAYRLYTLALAGKPHYSAMNRMKSMSNLTAKAGWRLAAAYAVAGKENAAKDLISGIKVDYADVSSNAFNYTYASAERDQAMVLETMILLGMQTEAFKLLEEISEKLSSDKWMSTQTVSYSLIALSKFVDKYSQSEGLNAELVFNGKTERISSSKPISKSELLVKDDGNKISLKNTSSGVQYVRLMKRGVPFKAKIEKQAEGIDISVKYIDFDGNMIDESDIEQGTDFLAQVKIQNLSGRNLTNLALTHFVPSGWEIINTRLFNTAAFASQSSFDYQNIRDDKVLTYFNLSSGNTKTFYVMLNASYKGEYMLPVIKADAMYDNSINAVLPGKTVKVSTANTIEN